MEAKISIQQYRRIQSREGICSHENGGVTHHVWHCGIDGNRRGFTENYNSQDISVHFAADDTQHDNLETGESCQQQQESLSRDQGGIIFNFKDKTRLATTTVLIN